MYYLSMPFDRMAEWIRNVPNEGLIRYYMVGNLERLLLTSPKALSEVLAQKAYDFPKPEGVRQSLERITGYGVLLAEGDDHKVCLPIGILMSTTTLTEQMQRRNLMPAFSYRHIKDLYPVFWSKSVEMVKLIEQELSQSSDNVVQVSNWASRATLDIVGIAGMDYDFESLHHPENSLNGQYRRLMVEPTRIMKIFFLLGFIFQNVRLAQAIPFRRNREIAEASRVIRGEALRVIRAKKEKLEKDPSSTGVDIISVALQHSDVFTDENLVDQMMTFIGAGHETTATALQWAVYALCKHPEIQDRLRDEIRENLPPISTGTPDSVSAATLDSLPYLNAVCNEVLRYYPSVPGTARVARKDTTLLGKRIPRGTYVLIVPKVINRSEEMWGPDADKFNPDRWLGPGKANTGGAVSNYAFLTFIHGPRSCIGQGFARSEMACLVAATVGRFKMELKYPDAKLETRLGPTVSPKDGVLAKFTPLEGW